MLTDTMGSSNSLAAVLSGPVALPNTSQPRDNNNSWGAVNNTRESTSYNNTPRGNDTAVEKSKQNFNDTLEQQINKTTQQDKPIKEGESVDKKKLAPVAESNQQEAQAIERPEKVKSKSEEKSKDTSKNSSDKIEVNVASGVTDKTTSTAILNESGSKNSDNTEKKQVKTVQGSFDKKQDVKAGKAKVDVSGNIGKTQVGAQKDEAAKASVNKDVVAEPSRIVNQEVSKVNSQSTVQNTKDSINSQQAEVIKDSITTKQPNSTEKAVEQSDVATTTVKGKIPQNQQFENPTKEDISFGEKHPGNKKDSKEGDIEPSSSRTENKQSDSTANTVAANNNALKNAMLENQATTFQSKIKDANKGDDKTSVNQTAGRNVVQGFGSDNATASVAQAAKSTNTSSLPSNSSKVAEQVQESFSTAFQQGDRQITIRLNPPELGSVKITIKQEDKQITGLLEASEVQTRSEIQQTLPQIIRNLQDMGIQVKRLDVAPGNDQGHHASMGHSFGDQENRRGSDGSDNSDTRGGDPDWYGATDWTHGIGSYVNGQTAYGSFVTDSSINMLV